MVLTRRRYVSTLCCVISELTNMAAGLTYLYAADVRFSLYIDGDSGLCLQK